MFTVAVMQPYFFPYAGYFRLFAATDLFVIFDCVQFPRRGWVHRNTLPLASGQLEWLTLPLIKMPQSVKICDLRFPIDAKERFQLELRRFPSAENFDPELFSVITNFSGSVVDYLESTMKLTCQRLNLPFNIIRSSSMNISPELRGESRILEILNTVKAERYVNAPGGKDLYHSELFKNHNLKLEFLNDYTGSYTSILHRLITEPVKAIQEEILSCIEIDYPLCN